MGGLSHYNMRNKSQWLVLAATLFSAASTVSMTLLWTQGRQLPVSFGAYASPQRCRECHAAKYQAWSGAIHAGACSGQAFQAFVQTAQEPGKCYSCHATGYEHATGQFALAGVTCEACHGPYQAKHSGNDMAVTVSQDLCGACHTSTWAEWASSRHGKIGVTCTDCHEVHSQKTRSTDQVNAPCIGCHQDQAHDASATTRLHCEAGMHCIDCHLVRPDDATRAQEKDHAATGHSFSVFVSTCSECHDLPLQSDLEFH